MSSAFKDRLRQIRDQSAQQTEVQMRLRSDEDLLRTRKTVLAFEFRERGAGVIEEYAHSFQSEAPGFVLTRGFFEGKYMLALRLDEASVEGVHRSFSRLLFLLDPHSDEDTFAVRCKKTIRDRDVDSQLTTVPMTDEGLGTLGAFIEAHFLDFAQRFFEQGSPLGEPRSPIAEPN